MRFFVASRLFLIASLGLQVAFGQVNGLNFKPVDAEYSKALDRVIFVSDSPAALIVYSALENRIDGSVSLPLAPTALTLDPTGLTAAVGHDGRISLVDLNPLRYSKTLNTSCVVNDLVLPGNGSVYVLPKATYSAYIRVVSIDQDQETTVTGYSSLYGNLVATLHPSGTSLYATGLSLGNIQKVSIANGTGTYLYQSTNDVNPCGNMWISKDGSRLFGRCGTFFRTSNSQQQDMTYGGTLPGIQYVRYLSQAERIGKVLAIQEAIPFSSQPLSETDIWFFNYEFSTLDRKVALPAFSVAGQSYKSLGRWVFPNRDETHWIAVVQADPASGLIRDFGVVVGTLQPRIGDFNGDSRTDLLWQNDASREAHVWNLGGVNGMTFLGGRSLSNGGRFLAGRWSGAATSTATDIRI